MSTRPAPSERERPRFPWLRRREKPKDAKKLDAVQPDGEQVDRDYPWWMKMLAALGGVALLATVVTLFFGYGRRPADIELTSAPPVDSREFLLSIAGIARSPLVEGGTVELLDNGAGFIPPMLEAIRGARQTINFSAYIWEDGVMDALFTQALAERARAGVEVRVLRDGFGGLKMPEDSEAELKAAGVKLRSFRSAAVGKLSRFHKRNHRRAIVIDGRLAFTGGMAVGDKWLGDARFEDHWRDSMVRVSGPPASLIQSAFVDAWAYSAGELLVGEAFFPDFAREGWPALLPRPGNLSMPSTAVFTGLASAPSNEDHPMRLFFLQTFSAARQKLYISTPYFVPDPTIRRAVADRARAGVDVRILLPDEHTDARVIRLTTHKYFEELMQAGVRVYEYQTTMMHTKHVVVDGQWAVVGSANMDIRSKELNHENVLGVRDRSFAADLERTFLADLRHAREIRPEEWKQRSLLHRFGETVAELFAEQY